MAVDVLTQLGPGNDTLALAKGRVTIGPVPPWARPLEFNPSQQVNGLGSSACLLQSRQLHAELHQVQVHEAVRLMTMQAVDRASQWRLQFDPRTTALTVHWIRIHRDNSFYEQAKIDRFRFLEREEGLEGLTVTGRVTILLLLEDVRPGDVLETCYTLEARPTILPEHCCCNFSLPAEMPVGKFLFSVRFNPRRSLNWKSSSSAIKPAETVLDEEVIWTWSGEAYTPPKPESNMPDWHTCHPWLRLSDCPDWNTVAAGFFKAWEPAETDADDAVGQLTSEIMASEPDSLRRVEKAIHIVQNEFRHLNIVLELGGLVPTPPAIIARRRFGDCKDLSLLLVQLLRALGVAARPVLVNAQLRHQLMGMLPAWDLFNHVVVEFRIGDQTRWVDVTLKRQGGGALNRFVPDYGAGLIVDSSTKELSQPPADSTSTGVYELKETILLDTTGDPSLLAVAVHATGEHAEKLRRQFEFDGIEAVANERLKHCTERFYNARRAGSIQHRDDRSNNEFYLTEVFEIEGFLELDEESGLCRFLLPRNLALECLAMPETGNRKAPFALPYPWNAVHTIEVQSSALQAPAGPRGRVSGQFVNFTRSHKSLSSYWSITFNVSTLAGFVPPDRLAQHRSTMMEIRRESEWELLVAPGYSHPRRRSDFGELPPILVHRPIRGILHGARKPEGPGATGLPRPPLTQPIPSSLARTTLPPPSTLPDDETDLSPDEALEAQRAAHRRKLEMRNRKTLGDFVWPVFLMLLLLGLVALFVFACRDTASP